MTGNVDKPLTERMHPDGSVVRLAGLRTGGRISSDPKSLAHWHDTDGGDRRGEAVRICAAEVAPVSKLGSSGLSFRVAKMFRTRLIWWSTAMRWSRGRLKTAY